MGLYMPKKKTYKESKASSSTSLIDSVMENTPEEDKIKYISCIQCGELMRSNAQYCPNCGHNKSLPEELPIIDEKRTEGEKKTSRGYYIASIICISLSVISGIAEYFLLGSDRFDFLIPGLLFIFSSGMFVLFIVFFIDGIVHGKQIVYKNRPYKIKGKNAGAFAGVGLTIGGLIISIVIGIMFLGLLVQFITCRC